MKRSGRGIIAGALFTLGRWLDRAARAVDDALEPGRADGTDRDRPIALHPEPEDDAVRTDRAVGDVLETLGEQLGARRMVVWRMDRDADMVTPEHTLGLPPAGMKALGNPLIWVVEERHPMRLEPAPSWSQGQVVAAPIDEARALTVETESGGAPEPEHLVPAAEIVAALLTLVDRQAGAREERERLRRVVGFLRDLSRNEDPDDVPAALGLAALDLVGGRGAVVASWAGNEGVILTREGENDGPAPGHGFGRGEGDLAHAARTSATVRRTPTDLGDRPALAGPGERWNRVAPYRVVVPLRGPERPGGMPGGLVAVWGDRPPAEDGIALLEAVGPLLSLHLRNASDLVRFREQATVDTLTGLPNRAAFDERLAQEQAWFRRFRRPVALLVLDLDHFKRVNDTHGHEAGDVALRAVADAVRAAVRDVDLPARYGGEELVVLMSETMLRAAQDVAERVRGLVAGLRIEHEGAVIPVTVSVGVSACPERVEEPTALFDSADAALYRAKQEGRDRVVVA